MGRYREGKSSLMPAEGQPRCGSAGLRSPAPRGAGCSALAWCAALLVVCLPELGGTGFGVAGQAILTLDPIESDVTEQELNQGTAFQFGDGGLTISVTGAAFKVPLDNTVKQSIINDMVVDVTQTDGFSTHKASLVQISSVTNTATTIVIAFRAESDYDINTEEYVNITIPDAALTTAVGIMKQPDPLRIQVSTGTIVIAKRPYENPSGMATGHVMTETDARSDRPSFYVAVSPWENWRQFSMTPSGVNNMATNCTTSNRPDSPYGWNARVGEGKLVEWHTSRFTDSSGNYLKLNTIPGLDGWRYLEVFITPDPNYDTAVTETITIDANCVSQYLGSGLRPNPNVKLSFDIIPTAGTYSVATTRGDTIWETDLSVGAHCNWYGVTSVQFGEAEPFCDYTTSVSNPSQAAGYSPMVISINLEKGETWTQDSTAQQELISSFTSSLGSDFIAHLDEFFKDTSGSTITVAYPDDWTAQLSVRTWPTWAKAKRAAFEAFDVTIEEYVELAISHRSVASQDTSISPQKSTAGSGKKPGFTIKPAPGWLVAEANTQQCLSSSQAVCSGGCSWSDDSRCVTTDDWKKDLIFTESELRSGAIKLSLFFGSPPGYLPDTQVAIGGAVMRPFHASTTETWCTAVLATATVTSTRNRCTKVVDHTDLRLAMTSDLTTLLTTSTGSNEPLPTYWNAREDFLLTASSVSVSPSEISVSIPADTDYDIWTEEVIKIYIPGWTGTATSPIVTHVMTSSGIIPVGQPLNLTIVPDYGVLTVKHETRTHDPSFIEFTEEEIRQGAGKLILTWQGEMWRVGCCGSQLRGGGGYFPAEVGPGGLRLMSERTIFDNPMGWNARVENGTELIPDSSVVVSAAGMPAGVTMYGRTLEITLQPDPFYDTSAEEHITISISPDAVISSLSYMGNGFPRLGCDPQVSSSACSDFAINIKPVGGAVMCEGGASSRVCPDITEEDVRSGGKVIIIRLDVGETWNAKEYPAPFQATLIGHMNSVVTTSSEPTGFQARKSGIVLEDGVVADMGNSSRELIITLTADPGYDLVNNAREEVRIEIFPRAVTSGLITTPQVLSFNIIRVASELLASACLGVQPDGASGDPSPTLLGAPEAAWLDCATGNSSIAQVHRVRDPADVASFVISVVVTEQDLRKGDVSVRITLGCGESWQTSTQVITATGKTREELVKEAFAGIPRIDEMLSTAGLATQVIIPSLATCPQTLSVLLKKVPDFDISTILTTKIKFVSAMFTSGEDHGPVYFTIIPFTGTALLNVKENAAFENTNNVFTTGETVDSSVNSPLRTYILDENRIRTGGFVLNITFEVGETWRNTEACRLAILGNFAGLLNPNQDPSYSYKDPSAWGPGVNSVHNTALGLPAGVGTVEFHPNGEKRTVLVKLQPVPNYDISVAQNVTVDVSAECAESFLKPWWEDEVRQSSGDYSVTVTESPDLSVKQSRGDIYTQHFNPNNEGRLHDSGIPGIAVITITPAPGYLRLEMTDGRGCSGSCTGVTGDIEITDLEIRNGLGTNRLRLILEGETWAVSSDTQAGTTCAAAAAGQWCLPTVPRRDDVCAPTTGTTCQCTTPPFSTCCGFNYRCDTSAQSPTLADFNFKTALWYNTYVFGEDFPKPTVAGGGTFTGTVGTSIIPSQQNPTTGFSARKDTVLPAPALSPAATSVTFISEHIVELTLSQDATFDLAYDELGYITVPGYLLRSGLDPVVKDLNFSFVVSPIKVALGPKSTFTEREIRQGVTLTFTITTPGCWSELAEPLVVKGLRSDRTAVDEPYGWEAMVRGPAESTLFVNGNRTDYDPLNPTACRKTINIPINATSFGFVSQEDSYDITQTETVTLSTEGAMVGSSRAPVGDPTNPLTITITPEAGGVEIYPATFYEYDIRTCVEPKELVVRLFGESWPFLGPGLVGNPSRYIPLSSDITGLQNCLVDAMDGVTRDSEFDRLKRDPDGHALIDPASIVFRNPWEAVIPINCSRAYNSRDPEIVLVDLPPSCVKSGLKPIAAAGASPPRFQIQIEEAPSVALMDKVLMERDIREGPPCITIILTGPHPDRNDTFVDDSSRIFTEMSSNQGGAGWEAGFNARKSSLLHPDNIRIIHQTSLHINDPAPAPGSEDRPKLLVCFRKDEDYQIHAEEVVTITIHGTAVSSGISPNYLDNEQLQVVIKPSAGNVTLMPDLFYEDDLREGSVVLTMTMEPGEEWAFNPSSCFIGPTDATCNGPIPTRAMCECANNLLCDPLLRTPLAQPYGFNARFGDVIKPSGFVFNTQNPLQLELRFAPDILFDITEDQQVRVEIPGCATRSGVPTLTQYMTILRTPGKLSLVSQEPVVGSNLPCMTWLCSHNTPLSFTERDIRNGSVELVLRLDGDLWRNRPLEFQAGIQSDCPSSPPSTGLSRPYCVDGFNAKLHDIVPSGAIQKVPNSADRLLRVSFTPVPTYNIDFTETVCFNVKGTVTASNVDAVAHPEKFVSVYGMGSFCFNVTAVPGIVDVKTIPPKLCESNIRLGTSSFTIVVDEEFWDVNAPTILFSHIFGNQTCDATKLTSAELTTCTERFDQNRVFVGQKTKGLLPTSPSTGVELTKVRFLDGPAPYLTQLYYPFPDKSLIQNRPRPWYNIREDEKIMIDVVPEAVLSGMRPIFKDRLDYNVFDPSNPNYNSANLSSSQVAVLEMASFDIISTKISFAAPLVFDENAIRNSSTLKFNLTLECDQWIPGSEVLITRAFEAEQQPAPFPLSGWAGRRDSILRVDIMKDDAGDPTILQVSILPDPEFDICTATEDIAIDFSIHPTHFTEAEVTQIFESAEAPTPFVPQTGLSYYKTDINPKLNSGKTNKAWDTGDFLKITIQNQPATASINLWKNGIEGICDSPCVFSEDEIRQGIGGLNVSLDANGNGFSDPSLLSLGFNSSLLGLADSFLDRVCTIAPRTGVMPQPPLTRAQIDLRYAIMPFAADPLFDIVEDEVVTFSIPDGSEVYDKCQQKTWPSGASACYIKQVPFSFTIRGRPGRAESCNMTAFSPDEQVAGRRLQIGIEGYELDSVANSDVAFLLPKHTVARSGFNPQPDSVRCNTAWQTFVANGKQNAFPVNTDSPMMHVYGWTPDFAMNDLKGQRLVNMAPAMDYSGVFAVCYRNKFTTDFYAVDACDATVVGDPHGVVDWDRGEFGPFRVGLSYNITFRGRGLRGSFDLDGTTRGDWIKIVSDEVTCDADGRVIQELNSHSMMSTHTTDAVSGETYTFWDTAVFFESGGYRMCYRAYRSNVWKDLSLFRVLGVVEGFSPRTVNASHPAEVVITGKGLMNYDRLFGVYTPVPAAYTAAFQKGDALHDELFDPNLVCSSSYPGDTHEVLKFPDVMGFDTAHVMDDIAKIRLKLGTFYRPGYYHLCYGFNNESQWDVVPGGTLRVITSATSYSPTQLDVYNIEDPRIISDAKNPYRDLIEHVAWVDNMPITFKAVLKGQSCKGQEMGFHWENIPSAPGPNVTTEPAWDPYQKSRQKKGGFNVPGTYYWCYTVRELLECPPSAVSTVNCPPDQKLSPTGWFVMPEPFTVTPLFNSFSPEFVPAGEVTRITVTSITRIENSLGNTVTLKLNHPYVSCLEDHIWDEPVVATGTVSNKDNTGLPPDQRQDHTLSFDATVERSGEYLVCLGDHRVGRRGGLTLKVYPVPTGIAPVDMELRSEKVNPTRLLPGSAQPLPLTFLGKGLHSEGDTLGAYRQADVFGAIPWGVPEQGVTDPMSVQPNYTCGNYSLFDPSPFSTREESWWYPSNKDVVRVEGDPARSLAAGTTNRATALLWNTTFTPGNYQLCLYDWVRGMWVDVMPEPFYVPPNTPPQLDIISQDITLHPNSGLVNIGSFLFSSKAGLYNAENDQTVVYTVSQDLDSADITPFVPPRVPQYIRSTNTLTFELMPAALAGKYRFAMVAVDNGGTLYSGNDTGFTSFFINVKGVTHASVVPQRIDVKSAVNISLYGEGLSAMGPNGDIGDCVRIVDANDPTGCYRQATLPEVYNPTCPPGLPNCYTPEDQRRFAALRQAWYIGNAEGPYVLPEVVPPQLQPDPQQPDPEAWYRQLVQAWRDGKYASSVYDICGLTDVPHTGPTTPSPGGNNPFVTPTPGRPTLPPSFGGGSFLTATYLTSPRMHFPGEYSLCYKLKGDNAGNWLAVRNSSFVVTALVEEFTPHSLYAGLPASIEFKGAGFSNVDEVVAVWVAGSTIEDLDDWESNTTCSQLSVNTNGFFTNTFAVSNFFRGFTYPTNTSTTATQGLNYTTLPIGDGTIRRPGHYKLCYRVGATNDWVDAQGGLLRVFAAISSHDTLVQQDVGISFTTNLMGFGIEAPPGGRPPPANMTVTYKVVKSVCDDNNFPNCAVNCRDLQYEVQAARIVTNVVTVPDGQNDGLSRKITETFAFPRPGYYYFCWTTEEIRNCRPKTSPTNPGTTCVTESDDPYRMMRQPIVVTPAYTSFTPYVVEAGQETLVTVKGTNIYPFSLGPPGLVLRSPFNNATACRQMGLPYQKQTQTPQQDHAVYTWDDSRNTVSRSLFLTSTANEVSFKINMTRAGDYDVCIGMTRVGFINPVAIPPNCPLWTQQGAGMSQAVCSNISTALENSAIRVQPYVAAVSDIPVEERPYGVPMNLTLEGWGLQAQDRVFVINGTDGSECAAYDTIPQLAKFGVATISEPFLQVPYAGTFTGLGNTAGYSPLNITDATVGVGFLAPVAQPFGIVRANLTFAFPRPGEYRLCYHTSQFGWSREVQPNFVIPSPNITDWDWSVVTGGVTPFVQFQFFGYGLSSISALGDKLMIVRNDHISTDSSGKFLTDPCQRPTSDFAVADRSENLGPGDAQGLNETRFLWQDRDLNSFAVVRNYTLCYAFCWSHDLGVPVCDPYESVGEIQTPIRNFPPSLDLEKDFFYTRPCSNVSVFRTPPTPGRPQEQWDTRSKAHLQNVTYTVSHSKQAVPPGTPGGVVSCGSCPYADPYVNADGLLVHSFTALGKYDVTVRAVDDGGTDLGGIDTTSTDVFVVEVTGQNTPPVFEVPASIDVVMSPTGIVQSGPVVIGNVTGGVLEWEKLTQAVYFDVSPSSGTLAPHFTAKPTYDSVSNTFTLPLTSYNKTRPVEIPLTMIGYDDLLRGPTGDKVPQICGESRTVKTLTVVVHPVNQPPLFNWQSDTTILVYPGLDYKLNLASPTVGPDYEVGEQSIVMANTSVAPSVEGEFTNLPLLQTDGVLMFKITENINRVVPMPVAVQLFIQDNGGTTNGGVDTSMMTVILYIGDFFSLSVSPTTQPYLVGSVAATVTGGLPSGVMKIHYLWRGSGGSLVLPEFLTARGSGDRVVKIGGPGTAVSGELQNLPEGKHTLFTLLFPAGVVDFGRIEANGADLCPSSTSSQVIDRTGPCYLAAAVTVVPSNASVTDIVNKARDLANNENVPASEAFVTVSSAASQIATRGDSNTAPSQRESLLTNVLTASKRVGSQPGLIADDLANGVDAVSSVIGSNLGNDTDGVQLTDTATTDAIDALKLIGEANARLWVQCCSATTVPQGCTENNKQTCPASCCGEKTTDAETTRVEEKIHAAANGLVSAAASLQIPRFWGSKDQKKDMTSFTALSQRRAAAAIMDNILVVLTQSGESLCRTQLEAAVQKNKSSGAEGYADEPPSITRGSEFTMHVQAMHRSASTQATDAVSLPHTTRGTVTGTLPRFSTTAEETQNGCRILIAFFTKLTHRGDGEPAKTPVLPVVAVKLTAMRDDGTATLSSYSRAVPYTFAIPLSSADASRKKFGPLTWLQTTANWDTPTGGSAEKSNNTVTVQGTTIQAFVGPQSRDAAVLQTTSFQGVLVGASSYDALEDSYCFACTALPTYWALFFFFILLAMLVSSAYDHKRYKAGSAPEAIDHATPGVTTFTYLHMWLAPTVLLPSTLAYYARQQRVLSLFTFFMAALSLCAPFYDNDKLTYDWEHSVDGLKALYSGVVTGLMGWLISSVVRFILFPGPVMPKRVKKRSHAADESDPLKDNDEVNKTDKIIPAKGSVGRIMFGWGIFFTVAVGGTLMVILLTNNYTAPSQGDQYMLTFLLACVSHIVFEVLHAIVFSKTGHYEGGKNRPGEVAEFDDDDEGDEMGHHITPPDQPLPASTQSPSGSPHTPALDTDLKPFGTYTPLGTELAGDGGFRPSFVGANAPPRSVLGRGSPNTRLYNPDTFATPSTGMDSIFRSHTQRAAVGSTMPSVGPLSDPSYSPGLVRPFAQESHSSVPAFVPPISYGRGTATGAPSALAREGSGGGLGPLQSGGGLPDTMFSQFASSQSPRRQE